MRDVYTELRRDRGSPGRSDDLVRVLLCAEASSIGEPSTIAARVSWRRFDACEQLGLIGYRDGVLYLTPDGAQILARVRAEKVA